MKCRDCGAAEGRLHAPFCTKERCPFCWGQLAGCSCIHEVLSLTPEESLAVDEGIDDTKEPLRTILDRWKAALRKKGRVPYIEYPAMCARCGARYPEHFRVPDDEWSALIDPIRQDTVLCKECFAFIKTAFEAQQADPEAL